MPNQPSPGQRPDHVKFPLAKSFFWFFLTLVVGLSQVWIMLFISYIKKMDFPSETVMVDGVLVFFSIVLVSSIMIDYFLFEEPSNRSLTDNGFVKKFMFSFFPMGLILGCGILFAVSYVSKLDASQFDIDFITFTQFMILAITAIYAILVKLDNLKK